MKVSALLGIALWLTALASARADKVNDAALMAANPPRMLSAYGLFVDPANQIPNVGVLPYDLVTPLFTDYASKYRFVYIPGGKSAEYREREAFAFPVGTTLVKTFAYPGDLRKPNEQIRLIETRLLIRQDAGWKAWAYVWNEDMSDARLRIAGKRLPVSVTHRDGSELAIDYVVPNANQCKGCHALNKELTPIGPNARNLNHDYSYAGAVKNQLRMWVDLELLKGAPDIGGLPRAADWRDESEPLDKRARSYLDVNCAHCHRKEGPASNSGLFLTAWEDDRTAWGYRKRPVAAGRGSGGLEFGIEPGDADRSILIYRMRSNDPAIMMPELGRTLVHEEAVTMLEAWINGLK
ncbi:SO2930 family diheme c-type cytochrome [Nitratireductor sp. XY-223]|uniref:SO2930 family diheme c-type cytochrome n=1 Tax=Nitratireductor sp. XY-223 TaxID=2561926 RepID=UPI0010AB06ED|nr:SO2930 family diheme c-type cytochrome [Nitratireductor sp. XY-223]